MKRAEIEVRYGVRVQRRGKAGEPGGVRYAARWQGLQGEYVVSAPTLGELAVAVGTLRAAQVAADRRVFE